MVLVDKKLSRVLKNQLVVFVIEPENRDVWIFVVFYDKNLHHTFICLSKSQPLLLNDLLIAHVALFFLLFLFQLFLVIINDLKLFDQLFGHGLRIEYFFFHVRILFVGCRVKILEFRKLAVGYQTRRVVVSHSNSVWIEHIRHAEFWIFFWIYHPYKGSVFVSLIKLCLNFWDHWLVFN